MDSKIAGEWDGCCTECGARIDYEAGHESYEPETCGPCDYANVRAENVRLREALEWYADEGHYEGTYRHGAGFVDAVGLHRARAVLVGRDPDVDCLDGVDEEYNRLRRSAEGGK